MTEKKLGRKFDELRARAERILSGDGAISPLPSRVDLENLLHEIEVYQVELELQNEELRLSQNKLEESRNHYWELYNLAPVAFLTIDVNKPYPVLSANSMACRVLGREGRTLKGTSFSSLADVRDMRAMRRFISRLLKSDQEIVEEFLMDAKHPPRKFCARVQAVRVTEKKGQSRILVALSDISELVRAREVLKQDRDELEKAVQERTVELEGTNRELGVKNRELHDFAFIASHDLREPIRKVLTFGSMLEEKYAGVLDEVARDYLARMKKASYRMESMLGSLLMYSRLNSRLLPFEKVDLNEVLIQAQSNMADEVERQKAAVSVGKLPKIEADPQQMVQLFQNLLSNALKYAERPPKIAIYSEDGGNHCTIYVVDNGIGFELKYLDKIFSPFQRLHGRDIYEGTGMGLTICRKIVEHHNGGITATSAPGEGSVFMINLPYRQEGSEQQKVSRKAVKKPS